MLLFKYTADPRSPWTRKGLITVTENGKGLPSKGHYSIPEDPHHWMNMVDSLIIRKDGRDHYMQVSVRDDKRVSFTISIGVLKEFEKMLAKHKDDDKWLCNVLDHFSPTFNAGLRRTIESHVLSLKISKYYNELLAPMTNSEEAYKLLHTFIMQTSKGYLLKPQIANYTVKLWVDVWSPLIYSDKAVHKRLYKPLTATGYLVPRVKGSLTRALLPKEVNDFISRYNYHYNF